MVLLFFSDTEDASETDMATLEEEISEMKEKWANISGNKKLIFQKLPSIWFHTLHVLVAFFKKTDAICMPQNLLWNFWGCLVFSLWFAFAFEYLNVRLPLLYEP